MNILVVGGAGYIGAHTLLELISNGHKAVVFDNFSTGEKRNVDLNAKIYQGNILSKRDLRNVFGKYQFDAVIHFAALKSASESMKYANIYAETNIVGTLNLINVMLEYNVNKLIFSSTSAVYGEPQKLKINEDHPLKPINFYGFTKLQIEKNLEWFSKISKLKYVSLRYFNAAGYDKKSRIKIPEKNAPNLIPIIMKVLLGEKDHLKIYGGDYSTKDGTCVRDYIHVTDLATAHSKSLTYLQNNNKSISLNVATGSGNSVLEVVRKFEEILGIKVKYSIVDRRTGDPSKVISETKYINSPIGWKPVHSSLDSIVRSVLKIYDLG
jgi:UDP-glucose 4-epimerase